MATGFSTKRTECPVSREAFNAQGGAPKLVVEILVHGSDQVVCREVLDPREFSTGSLGWNANAKGTVDVAGKADVKCQVGLNVTLVGSKDLPR